MKIVVKNREILKKIITWAILTDFSSIIIDGQGVGHLRGETTLKTPLEMLYFR